MKHFTCCTWATLLCVVMSSTGDAQFARGVVNDSTARRPLAGVVVLGVDSVGATAAQAVTDSAGRYSLSLGRVRMLKFMRIGFRAREHPVTMPGDVAFSLSLERIPPILDAFVSPSGKSAKMVIRERPLGACGIKPARASPPRSSLAW